MHACFLHAAFNCVLLQNDWKRAWFSRKLWNSGFLDSSNWQDHYLPRHYQIDSLRYAFGEYKYRLTRREAVAALIEMELSRIIISEINDQQIIYLHEVDGSREFPILIGIFEADSINRRVKGEIPPRPLTHDLLKNTIEQLGGEPHDIIINSLHEHTYYAVIRVMLDGELVEIDSRPSDAIALSVHYDPPLPIFVDDEVLEVASQSTP